MHEFISKLLRYGVTGGIAAIVDAGGFPCSQCPMASFSLSPVFAKLVGIGAAFPVKFVLNVRIVFRTK